MTQGKISVLFVLRIIGAVIGSIGFFILADQQTILGTDIDWCWFHHHCSW